MRGFARNRVGLFPMPCASESNSRIVLGIDPGAKGAIALYNGDKITVFAMPTVDVRSGRTDKERSDIQGILALTRLAASLGVQKAYVENVWGIRGQGASQAAALGHNRGVLEAACIAAGLKVELVSAQRWKGDTGLIVRGEKADKEKSRAKAIELFPEDAGFFKPIRGERTTEQAQGHAEAALIARWGYNAGP